MRKDKNNKNTLTRKEAVRLNLRALKLLYKYRPSMIISRIICVIWNALTPYPEIYLSALIINELSGNRDPKKLTELVLTALIAAAVIATVRVLLSKWRDVKNAGSYFIMEHILFKKLLDMDFADIDSTRTHDLLSNIRQSNHSGGWGFGKVLGNFDSLIFSVMTILGGVALTVSLFVSKVPKSAGAYTVLNSPLFVLPVVAAMLLATYAVPMLSTKADSYWAKYSGLHALSNNLFSFYTEIGVDRSVAPDVRIYRQDIIFDKFFHDKEGTFFSKGFFAKLAKGPMGLCHAASAAISAFFTGTVYVFVCLKAWAGAFGIGSVTQYIASVTKVYGGLSSLLSTVGDMRNNAAFLRTTFEFLDIPNKMYQGSLTVEKRRDRDYEIEFKNVSFRYPGADGYALKNVNIKFKVGSRLAVVGMNGSGKTTFIKLLCRLYDPTEGEICLNGIDIRKYNYLDYMMVFSVVFQDFRLFSLKIGQNIASKTDYDKKLAADCLRKAGFNRTDLRQADLNQDNLNQDDLNHDDSRRKNATRTDKQKDISQEDLPRAGTPQTSAQSKEFVSDTEISDDREIYKLLETYINKDYDQSGIEISGGEAQKIAIARALYKDAPFIVLDEPTAALDPLAEAEIYGRFNDIAGDKTAIYISHRLSSCKFCDDIAVFHEGRVIQQGTHASLLADESGKYYELWNAQAQYYN